MASVLNRSSKKYDTNSPQEKHIMTHLFPLIRKRIQLNQNNPSKSRPVAIFPQLAMNNISRVSVNNQDQGMWFSPKNISKEHHHQQKPKIIHSKLNLDTNKNIKAKNYSTPVSRRGSTSPFKPLHDNSNIAFNLEIMAKIESGFAEKLRGFSKYRNQQQVSGAQSLINSPRLSPKKIDFTTFVENKIKYRPKKFEFYSNRYDRLNESDFDEMVQLDHIKNEIKIRKHHHYKPNNVSHNLKCIDELNNINVIRGNNATNSNSQAVVRSQLTKEEEIKVGILKKKMKISGMFRGKLSFEERKAVLKSLELDYHPDKAKYEKQTCEDITTFLINNRQLFLQYDQLKSIGSMSDLSTIMND